MSSRNTCHQILIAAGRPGLAAVDERGVLLQELFAVGWDICGSFTRPQNAARRVRNGLAAGGRWIRTSRTGLLGPRPRRC